MKDAVNASSHIIRCKHIIFCNTISLLYIEFLPSKFLVYFAQNHLFSVRKRNAGFKPFLINPAFHIFIFTLFYALLRLANTLCFHSVYNFFESCNISTNYIISFYSISFCSIRCFFINIFHYSF